MSKITKPSDLTIEQKNNRITPDKNELYWEWFDAWWEQDFSWGEKKENGESTGLARHKYGIQPHERNLQDYWQKESENLIEFAGREWTRFHLPPHDLEGNLETKWNKHGLSFVDWEQEKWINWKAVIILKLQRASEIKSDAPDTPAQFTGVCFPNDLDLSRDETTMSAIGKKLPHTLHLNANFAQFGNVHFNNREFGKHTSFANAQFGHWANFTNTKFTDTAGFSNAYFRGSAFFSNKPDATKGNNRNHPAMYFNNAHFESRVDFRNRNFGERSSFYKTKFLALSEFYGCTFHQDISFDESYFKMVEFGILKSVDGKEIAWREKSTNWNESNHPAYKYQKAFQTLRLQMEKLRDHGQELKFAKLEMQARERRVGSKDVPCLVRWLSRGYGLISDYGQSALRPFLWLIGFYIIASVIYYTLAGEWASPGAAMATAFQYSLPPVSTFAAQFFAGEVDQSFINALLDHPFLTRFVMVTHGVISLALVFFLLLALKRRFQIR